jgi:hypothetical protein
MVTVGFIVKGGGIGCPAAMPADGEKRYSNKVKYLSGGTNDSALSRVHFCNLQQSPVTIVVARKHNAFVPDTRMKGAVAKHLSIGKCEKEIGRAWCNRLRRRDRRGRYMSYPIAGSLP